MGEARQLLFLLDRMRKRAAVKHAGERLGVFGLTELDQGRRKHNTGVGVVLPPPSECDTRALPLHSGKFTWQSYPRSSQ